MVLGDFWGIIKSEKNKEREIMDQRIIKLSDMLTSYSCDLQKGDRVLIDYEGEATRPLV